MKWGDWIDRAVAGLKERIGDDRALVACSGGVDSSVCAALTYRAVGDRARIVLIDDGLMRSGEGEEVLKFLKDYGIEIIDAEEEFFSALAGIEDGEEKRKAFRDQFYHTLGRIVEESGAKILVQGTIKADIDETKAKIKTQHNVLEQIGISPSTYGLEVMEPLRELYKPQVREIASELGLPEYISKRMPFPGPGLATRILGEVTRERVDLESRAMRIVEEEIAEARIEAFQAFAVLLNDRATGIMDGKRLDGDIVVVRVVQSKDALTAIAPEIEWKVLFKIRDRITREISSVSRVLYDLTPKPPATIEYI